MAIRKDCNNEATGHTMCTIVSKAQRSICRVEYTYLLVPKATRLIFLLSTV
jgi:hypothetical protein